MSYFVYLNLKTIPYTKTLVWLKQETFIIKYCLLSITCDSPLKKTKLSKKLSHQMTVKVFYVFIFIYCEKEDFLFLKKILVEAF